MSPSSIPNKSNNTIINIGNILHASSSTDGGRSEITKFYEGRSIFVTGATGFLGKAVVEKLLRSTQVKVVYILIRASRDKNVQTRFNELLSSSVFDILRYTNPDALKKISPIVGDVTLPGLGISFGDQTLSLLHNEVSIVIHCAATVKFNEPLRVAAEVNVAGTKRVFDLCKQMKNLTAVVHVSTAFANCDREVIKEVVYPTPTQVEPQNLVKICELLHDDILDSITPKLLGARPNTYILTKAVTEYLVEKEANKLPVCIVRPSIVTGALQEPYPGWVDMTGIAGVFAACGAGLIRKFFVREEMVVDMIPVDLVVNTIIAAAWRLKMDNGTTTTTTTMTTTEGCRVYNCCTGTENPLLIRELGECLRQSWKINPPLNLLWIPNTTPASNRFWYNVQDFFLHYIPAYVRDWFASATGTKPIALKIYYKLRKATSMLEFFLTHEWKFDTKNMKQLHAAMGPTDQNLFYINVQDIHWPEYFLDFSLGIRQNILKENPDTLPASRDRLWIMYRIQWLAQIFIVICIAIVCYWLIV